MKPLKEQMWHVNAIHKGRIVGDETAAAPVDKYMICGANHTIATVYKANLALLVSLIPGMLRALEETVAIADGSGLPDDSATAVSRTILERINRTFPGTA